MSGSDNNGMSKATMIVPIGTFTPELSRWVRESALEGAQRRDVIISLQSTERYSWSALCDFAESLRASVTPYRIRLARAVPRTRALLRELGIGNAWFVREGDLSGSVGLRKSA